MRAKTKKITILPREPLTQKALRGIEAYAWARCKGVHIFNFLVKYTLEAERMRRVDLYAWLEKRGYIWDTVGWRGPEDRNGA
jgi:hypothetical protein